MSFRDGYSNYSHGNNQRNAASKRTDSAFYYNRSHGSGNRRSGHSNSRQSPSSPIFSTEFTVPSNLMGLAIGGRGANIRSAKKLPNIVSIEVEDDSKFRITATTEKACEEARSMLEFVERSFDVPRNYVSRAIGKSGGNIHEIVDRSGVFKIKVVGGKGEDNQHESVPFVFTGTNNAVLHAQALLDEFIADLQLKDQRRAYYDDFNY